MKLNKYIFGAYLILASFGVIAAPIEINRCDTVTMTLGGDETITEGDTFSRTINFLDATDTGSDGWTYDVDWCGTPDNNNSILTSATDFTISKLFSSAGICDVTVTITDAVGESNTGTFTIITNAVGGGLVNIETGGRVLVKEGSVFSKRILISDAVDTNSDGHTYTLKFDGNQVASGVIPAAATDFRITRNMPDGDKRVIAELTVTDTGGDVVTDTFEILVQNVPPVAVITGDSSATVGSAYNMSVSIVDPGQDTVNTMQVDWGDGVSNDLTSHTYASAGTYQIKVWVDDDDGWWLAGTKRITVN